MILEIEGYQIKKNLSGKKCTKSRLHWQMKKTIKLIEGGQSFVSMFCQLFGYDIVEDFTDLTPDYLIDIDTYKIFEYK